MRKIDILNVITYFRKSPNCIKTYTGVLAHFGFSNEGKINALLAEPKQTKVLKALAVNEAKAYQVVGGEPFVNKKADSKPLTSHLLSLRPSEVLGFYF